MIAKAPAGQLPPDGEIAHDRQAGIHKSYGQPAFDEIMPVFRRLAEIPA
jgi:hypothetical protein